MGTSSASGNDSRTTTHGRVARPYCGRCTALFMNRSGVTGKGSSSTVSEIERRAIGDRVYREGFFTFRPVLISHSNEKERLILRGEKRKHPVSL